MKRCPITYEIINDNARYSQRGLRMLSPKLTDLLPLPFSAAEQRHEAIQRAGKMSIQGVQTKLSAILKIKEQCFDIVDQHGTYILKTQSALYPELPENEAITMTLAASIGLEVPVHGMLYAKDNTMTYFIKRFDRLPKHKKLAVEDFAQLLEMDRDTKYRSSMEQVANVITTFCTYPMIELVKLLKLTIFNFLIGNEDMHLKNFSLIMNDGIVSLSPCYDLLNTTIVLGKSTEEMALPLDGKKSNIRANTLLDYFAKQRLGLNEKTINAILHDIQSKQDKWHQLIEYSFLSGQMKTAYLNLLNTRTKILLSSLK